MLGGNTCCAQPARVRATTPQQPAYYKPNAQRPSTLSGAICENFSCQGASGVAGAPDGAAGGVSFAGGACCGFGPSSTMAATAG